MGIGGHAAWNLCSAQPRLVLPQFCSTETKQEQNPFNKVYRMSQIHSQKKESSSE